MRLVAPDRKSAVIADALGIAVPTVDAHIRSARQKLGGVGRFAAARLLAEWEAGISSTSQTSTMSADPVPMHSSISTPPLGAGSGPLTLGDARTPFDHGTPPPADGGGRTGRYDLNALNRIALIMFCLVALVVVGIAAIPLSDGVQQVARMVMTQRR